MVGPTDKPASIFGIFIVFLIGLAKITVGSV